MGRARRVGAGSVELGLRDQRLFSHSAVSHSAVRRISHAAVPVPGSGQRRWYVDRLRIGLVGSRPVDVAAYSVRYFVLRDAGDDRYRHRLRGPRHRFRYDLGLVNPFFDERAGGWIRRSVPFMHGDDVR